MKKYTFDTSGLSTPHEQLPEEVVLYRPVWDCVIKCIEAGRIGVTLETYKEMCHITGDVGECIKDNKRLLLIEVDDLTWPALEYIQNYNRMRKAHVE